MAAYLFSIIWPVALHMILSDFSVIILTAATGQTPDSALCTTLTAILVIPPVLWMYRGDEKPAVNRLKSVAEQDTKKELDDKENGGPTLTWRIFMGIACFVSGGILDRVWSQVLLWLRVQDYFSNQTQEQLLASAACCADHRAWNPGAGGGRTYFPWTFICKDPADASGMGECADSFSDFCTVSWKYDSDPVCLSDGNYSDAFV